ncbi:hypothetical protein RO3G_17359 [Rhizopus delemar RA 99-880]|uniref:Transposase Tc1-like domain-containing protein n=1 Tax=Rhizopus delemar (strain RA 99-880 / ATCC MYA-4621 / FGSC 9543 / NRRL 43880) TaxID=246409 RepID=I1CW18_RHIO9|nr:hypothetical protein RO3G_17359 [Rhizopus delemar RA 99-880]|eukprot:EIE92648.1 hypothetical protein RO3G_17359 [Rhizopus delemar RA 99-880]
MTKYLPYMLKKISNCKRESLRFRIHLVRTAANLFRIARISKWTINRIRKEEKNIKACDHGSRQVVVSKITNAIIRLKFRQGPLRTVSDAQLFLRFLGYNISKLSVKRHCRKLDFESGTKESKNFISCISQKKRRKWYRDKPSHTIEGWKSIIFSNEKNMNAMSADSIH